MRGKDVTPSRIREILFYEALARIRMVGELGEVASDDSFQSLLFLGPPGVGKSALHYLAARDVARFLAEQRGTPVEARKVSIRSSLEEALRVAESVASGSAVPYVHIYLPQTKIWHLEGTPSPMDSYADVLGAKVPINVWRLDPYLLPLTDFVARRAPAPVPGFLVLDEFNMARSDVLSSLFQLARSAELGRVKLSPLTVISLVGNTPETNALATGSIATPLVDRAQVYVVAGPDVPGWLSYMGEVYGDKWAREVGSYLLLNPREIYVLDPGDPGNVQTPRSWTQVAVRLRAYRDLRDAGAIPADAYERRVEDVVYANLTRESADKLIMYLRTLAAVGLSVDDVLSDPRILSSQEPEVAAFYLLRAVERIVADYAKAVGDIATKNRLLSDLARVVEAASKPLGIESVSLAMASLPIPVRIALAKKLGPELARLASETRRVADSIEQMLGA